MDRTRLRDQLEIDEALKLKPYKDSVGKLTIGIGRNLEDVGITGDEAMYLLNNDIDRVYAELTRNFPWFNSLNHVRQNVLMNMCFNIGIGKLHGFKNTLDHIKNGKYKEAAEAMLDSKWATQVGKRANRLAKMMETGEWLV